MADVFLMGTAGSTSDPNRSAWRDSIKAACTAKDITYFDPSVLTWDEFAMRREAQAMASCRVIVMAIMSHTPAFGSLSEAGWAAFSALKRKQAFGLYVDPNYAGDSSEAEASRRARRLVHAHAMELMKEFPADDLFVAQTLQELEDWTINSALRKKQQPAP